MGIKQKINLFLFIVLIVGTFFLQEKLAGHFILLTSLYHEKNEARCNEYKKCLLKNLEHPLIKKIVVFFDENNPDSQQVMLNFLKEKPIDIEYIVGRPLFTSLFEYVNQYYSGEQVIIANADIYFNETLGYTSEIDFSQKVAALTRWDELKEGIITPFMNHSGWADCSQDVWIFKAPIAVADTMSTELGTWNCDAKMGIALYKAGYKVINPARDIQCCHVHATNIRNYSVPRGGVVPGLTIEAIKDARIPISQVKTFFNQIDNVYQDRMKVISQKYSKFTLLYVLDLAEYKNDILAIFKELFGGQVESVDVGPNFISCDLNTYLENNSVFFCCMTDDLENYLLTVDNISVIWKGILKHGIKAYFLVRL